MSSIAEIQCFQVTGSSILYFYMVKPSVTMPRGRSAPSARSDGSEMDTDCTGIVVLYY